MQNKKGIILAIIGLLLVVGVIFIFKQNRPAGNNSADLILFYGNGCPHCVKVEAYLTDNKIAEKVSFEQKEVFENQDNAKLMTEKYTACGLNTASGMGVPFLWDGINKKCYSGDEEITNYFSQWAK